VKIMALLVGGMNLPAAGLFFICGLVKTNSKSPQTKAEKITSVVSRGVFGCALALAAHQTVLE